MAISPINLGNTFLNSSGQSVLSGISSGIDSKSIIDQVVAAQTTQVTDLEDQIKLNNNKATALTTLNQLLTSFKSSASILSNPDSPDTTSNIFAVRTIDVTSNTTQASSNFISAGVSSLAIAGSYRISDISQLATAKIQTTQAFTLASADSVAVAATSTANQFTAGTITVNGKDITLTEGQTLNQVASAFNDVSSDTGIQATVLQTDSGKYKIIFTGTETGEANSFDLASITTVTADPSGVLSNIVFANPQEANDASFKFNGVEVRRSSNNINDLVSGVSLNLLQDTTTQPGASFTLTVAPDTDNIANAVSVFAAAYNSFLTFYAQQTEIDSSTGSPKESAVLYSDTTLRDIFNKITAQASSIVSGLEDNVPDSLASVGITFTDTPATSTAPDVSNTLSVDSATLKAALKENFSQIADVFGYNLTSSSSNLLLYKGSSKQSVSSFTLNISNTTQTYTATYKDKNNVDQTINLENSSLGSGGVSLTGPEGSVLEGLVLIYGSSDNVSGLTVSVTQGIAAKIYEDLSAAIEQNTGLIAIDRQELQTKNTQTQKQITAVNEQIAKTRESLLTRFSELEAAVTKANSALNYLNAQQLATNS